MKILISTLLFLSALSAKNISTNDVYSQAVLINDNVKFLLSHYKIKHHHDEFEKSTVFLSDVRPRNVWQKTYEIMIKINILRNKHKLPTIEPANIEPVLNLNPELVYEQTQRLLTELKIFQTRMGIAAPVLKPKTFTDKTPADVFYNLSHASELLDELNEGVFTPSNVFAENIRVYDDLTAILQHLNIEDKTIPYKINYDSKTADTLNIAKSMLEIINKLHAKAGIGLVNFSDYRVDEATSSDVFGLTQMIIAELQPIKAYIGLNEFITPAARKYNGKTPVEVNQLMSWCLRKLQLITTLEGQK